MNSSDVTYIQDRLETLEDRIAKLEYHKRLLMSLVTPETNSFVYQMLEAVASEEQVTRVYDLMDSIRRSIDEGKTPISHGQFEAEIYKIFPAHNGNYGFAEGIVATLNEGNKWQEVYSFYQKNGMNI